MSYLLLLILISCSGAISGTTLSQLETPCLNPNFTCWEDHTRYIATPAALEALTCTQYEIVDEICIFSPDQGDARKHLDAVHNSDLYSDPYFEIRSEGCCFCQHGILPRYQSEHGGVYLVPDQLDALIVPGVTHNEAAAHLATLGIKTYSVLRQVYFLQIPIEADFELIYQGFKARPDLWGEVGFIPTLLGSEENFY